MANWQINDVVELSEPVSMRDKMTHVLMVPGNDHAHKWNVKVYLNGDPADMGDKVVVGHFIRPDDTDVLCEGSALGNVVSVHFNQYCYATPGVCRAYVNVMDDDGGEITFAEAYMLVREAMPGQIVDGGELVPNIDELIAQIDTIDAAVDNANEAAQEARDAAGDVTEANSYAKQAESWAVGGTGIREDEDTDNAKYYAESAETSKDTAISNANSARDYASQAANSAHSAQVQAGAASLSATRAATSEATAKGYADIASAVVETAQRVLDSIPEDYTALQDDVEGKLDCVQDAGYANKIMVIGNDGALVPGEAPVPVAVRSALLDIFRHVAYTDEQGAQKLAALESAMAVRTLTAISAAINQGSTVIYTDDGLDQLRPLMTVTATYSDGTTAVISDYTLTGTLAPGECVIGVQYGGMTDTVTVTATQPEVTVVALSVDFDPDGATIYTSTPLSDLRQYLTVMALYSNGMSAEASTYTIEGTLREGENTLTVRFKGQYALFGVTAAVPVPVRLEAVYNPPAGYVVYTDDDLDKVAAYLTVTEYYSDGSSVVVTDYTLTGTLVDGTSTLTVEYDALSATVQVEAVDFYNRMTVTTVDDTLVMLAGSVDVGQSDTVKYPSRTRLLLPYDRRRTFCQTRGKAQYYDYNGTNVGTGYYPTPVPAAATHVAISMIPDGQYVYVQIVGLDESTGQYGNSLYQSGWTQFTNNRMEFDLPAGANRYLVFNTKYDSAGQSYPVEPQSVTVEFTAEV